MENDFRSLRENSPPPVNPTPNFFIAPPSSPYSFMSPLYLALLFVIVNL